MTENVGAIDAWATLVRPGTIDRWPAEFISIFKRYGTLELFDLASDPLARQDLSRERLDLVRALVQELKKYPERPRAAAAAGPAAAGGRAGSGHQAICTGCRTASCRPGAGAAPPPGPLPPGLRDRPSFR